MNIIERLCHRQIESAVQRLTAVAVKTYSEEAQRLRQEHMDDLKEIHMLRAELGEWQRQAVMLAARTEIVKAKTNMLKDCLTRIDALGRWEEER